MTKKNYSLIGRAGVLLAAGLLAGTDANARHLEPAEALSMIDVGRLNSAPAAPLKLAYTQMSETDTPAVYVFDRNDAPGFYLLAADDAAGDIVLGYSHSGSFSPEDMSPGFRWLLDTYAQYVDECADGDTPMLRAMQASRSNISPLLTTKWDQKAPYNNDCPKLNGTQCVTGCVATAMAQVLNYHRYPTTGTGTHSYTWNGATLSFDYGATTFDWANMLDSYSSSSSYTQKAAVAKLMYGCGVSVDMNYTQSSSGSSDILAAYALIKYFGCNKDVRYLRRAFYNTGEWEELIYSELAASRPVIYGGRASGGGHEFVVDGYESGYFHINWGWGGLGDGNFRLDALDPGVSGTGGSSGGYNSDQSAVVGIRSAVSGTSPWYPIYANNSISATVYNSGKDAIIFNQGGVFSYWPENLSVGFLLKAVAENGNIYRGAVRNLNMTGMTSSLQMSGVGGFNLSLPTGLPNGTYKVYLEFKTPEGNIQPVLFPVSAAAYFNLAVNGKNVTITDGEPEARPSISVTDFSPASKVERGKPARFNVYIVNTGDITYDGYIVAKLYKYGSSDVLEPVQKISGLSLAAGNIFDGYVNLTLNYPDGKYTYRVYDMYDELVSDDFDFWIGENQDGIAAIPTDYVSADVYTLTGLLIKQGAAPDYVNSLAHGIYIIVIDGNAYKIAR